MYIHYPAFPMYIIYSVLSCIAGQPLRYADPFRPLSTRGEVNGQANCYIERFHNVAIYTPASTHIDLDIKCLHVHSTLCHELKLR